MSDDHALQLVTIIPTKILQYIYSQKVAFMMILTWILSLCDVKRIEFEVLHEKVELAAEDEIVLWLQNECNFKQLR